MQEFIRLLVNGKQPRDIRTQAIHLSDSKLQDHDDVIQEKANQHKAHLQSAGTYP